MNESLGNIYKQARKASGLSQEGAASYLGVSTTALSSYENGKVVPTDDMVIKMVHIYETPYLALQHMETHATAKAVMSNVEITQFAPSVLILHEAILEVTENMRTLNAIARNNKITDDEYTNWCKIEELLTALGKASFGVIFSIKDRD